MILFLKKYFGAVYFPIIWTLVIGTLCCLPGSMLPSEPGFSIPQFDKLVHFGMFGGFVFLWNLYLSKRDIPLPILLRWFFLFYILSNAYGIGLEYIQKYYIPNRDFDEADIIADMMGAGVAYGLSHLLLITKEKDS